MLVQRLISYSKISSFESDKEAREHIYENNIIHDRDDLCVVSIIEQDEMEMKTIVM